MLSRGAVLKSSVLLNASLLGVLFWQSQYLRRPGRARSNLDAVHGRLDLQLLNLSASSAASVELARIQQQTHAYAQNRTVSNATESAAALPQSVVTDSVKESVMNKIRTRWKQSQKFSSAEQRVPTVHVLNQTVVQNQSWQSRPQVRQGKSKINYHNGLRCEFDPEDAPYFKNGRPANLTSYIVLGSARTGSSWVQEVSMLHPWVKVQFELDFAARESALNCMQCHRPTVPNSKHMDRLPPRAHPPGACGQSIFGAVHTYQMIKEAGNKYDARILVILRLNLVALTISSFRHFRGADMVTYTAHEFVHELKKGKKEFDHLLSFPAMTRRPAFIVFYEDMVLHPTETFYEMQNFLRIPLIKRHDLNRIHKKSSNRHFHHYLKNLDEIRIKLEHSEWEGMLNDPNWDRHAPIQATFDRICNIHPATIARWRNGSCGQWAGIM